MGLTLWHVTASRNLPTIRQKGLSPAAAGRWIYLANSEHHARGYEAFFPGEEVILLSVDSGDLDETLLGPDDVDLPDMLEDDDLPWYDHTWEESLEICGQATYSGTIAWSDITTEAAWDSPDYRRNPIRPTKFYHVSLSKDEEAILQEGLLPQIGPRSQDIGETRAAIYLFPTKADMDNALMNWLGDEYPDDEWLTEFEISLPQEFLVEPTFDDEESWEWVAYQAIPAQFLKVINRQPPVE